jgi:hypothetical protein
VKGLPREPLVLFDAEGQRLFALQPQARAAGPLPERLMLLGARLLPDGQMAAAGRWRLETRQGRLTDPAGRSFFVDVDAERGLIRVRHAGTLRIQGRPAGAEVSVDGVTLGRAPLERKLPAGPHRVRLAWRGGQAVEQEVVVPARGVVSLELAP